MGRARWLLIWLALACSLAQGQARGQICIRAFADENVNGLRNAAEAPITRGIAASLLNEASVTIRTGLLDESPFAADGLLCFGDLLAGRYQVIISGSAYVATGAMSAEMMLEPGEPPPVFDFGARPLAALPVPATLHSLDALDADSARTLLMILGGLGLTVVVLSLLGCLLVLYVLRRRRARNSQPHREAGAGPPPRL